MSLPWDEAGWQTSVGAWISEALEDLGLEHGGPVEHIRALPWAAVARVPIENGVLYFKADPPSEAFEPALTSWLARRRPELVPEVLRIDIDRAWMLMRDAGTPLRELITDPPDAAIWDELLPLYAELQIQLIDSVGELLELATPDKRPGALAQGYEGLLDRWPDTGRAPGQAQIDALVAGLGDAIPASLAHEEFQDHNVLLRDGSPVVIDWAEAGVQHPFCGLVNTFRNLVDRWGFEPGTEGLSRARDAYLEPWTAFAPLPELVGLVDFAYPLGMLSRALTWDRLIGELGSPARDDYASHVPIWLELLAETLEGEATLGT